ncbi:DGQHR domain-containing protein DpdB [Acinetobacter indicus]|uniref:DGQHR domain-containing protein DpdB n=1 Tax=Acinetobacter indicus TaxID=756892 RepID=UPI002578F579|nr:DGQHR domain-containing protein DpdB [Acinetobacter indicus]MDM1328911.1 DGQHR domain-containing protein [Acinetobacter indicus]
MKNNKFITVKALRTVQGEDFHIFAFFIRAKDLNLIADISRLQTSDKGELTGFQRPEIKSHIKGIIEYLDLRNIIFPNSIILALSPEIKFSLSRGTRNQEDSGVSQSGTLKLPIFPKGERIAWIVDGQQRALALENTKNTTLPIPVIGFITNSLEDQREQFILVNKVKPLPSRLINELLPQTRSVILPKELNSRKLPAEICYLLNDDPASGFYKIIKKSSLNSQNSYINDTSVIQMIRNSLTNPLGALATFKDETGHIQNIEGLYQILVAFWNAVKHVFPIAWAKEPKQSRLTHSVGILAMGVLMDQIYARNFKSKDIYKMFCTELGKISSHCAWTEGQWKGLNLPWNELQNTPKDIKRLQEFLIHIYNQSSNQ